MTRHRPLTRAAAAVLAALVPAGCAFRTIPSLLTPPGMTAVQASDHHNACTQEGLEKATSYPRLGNAITGGILAAALGAATGAAVGAAVGGYAAEGAKIGAAADGPRGFVYGALAPPQAVFHRRLFNKVFYHCMLRAGFTPAAR